MIALAAEMPIFPRVSRGVSALHDPGGHARSPVVRISCFLVLACAVLTACSGTSVGTGTGDSGAPPSNAAAAPPANKFDALFTLPPDAPATPDSLNGVWSGWMTKSQQEVRVRIAADGLVLAMLCRDHTVGVEVAGSVSSASIRALENSSTSTSGYCSVIVNRFQIDKCTGQTTPLACFTLSGKTLRFATGKSMLNSRDLDYPESTFTKVSD